MIRFEKILEEEQNAFAQEGRANNGGGYHQPHIIYEDKKNFITIEVDDTSCGDFGRRYTVSVYGCSYVQLRILRDAVINYNGNRCYGQKLKSVNDFGVCIAELRVNEMDGDSFSTFDDSIPLHVELLKIIRNLGY